MMWDVPGSAHSHSSPYSQFPTPQHHSHGEDVVVPFQPIGAPSPTHVSYESAPQWPHTRGAPAHVPNIVYTPEPEGQRTREVQHVQLHTHHHSSSRHRSSSRHHSHSREPSPHRERRHSSAHTRPQLIVQQSQPHVHGQYLDVHPQRRTQTYHGHHHQAVQYVPHPPAPVLTHRQHSHFLYSKCTGRRKALCVGINYNGSRRELRGCVNDARGVQHYLINNWRYKAEDMVILTDDSDNPLQQPTRANILAAIRWLVDGANTHDSLFFHYSGHGGQVKDEDGDEIDGLDEVIFPVDYHEAGVITDDTLNVVMVHPLPPGCRLTSIFDSCHSGSVLDLPYEYHSDGRVKGLAVTPKHLREKTSPADVISWSGCMDSQTSADTYEGKRAVGAMSYTFIEALSKNKNQTYQQLLQTIRSMMKTKYSQKPQLSSSHRIDTNLQFIM